MRKMLFVLLLLVSNTLFSQNIISEIDKFILAMNKLPLTEQTSVLYAKTTPLLRTIPEYTHPAASLYANTQTIFTNFNLETNSNKKKIIKSGIDYLTTQLIDYLQLHDSAISPTSIATNLDKIRNYETIYFFFEKFRDDLKSLNIQKVALPNINLLKLRENLKLVENQLVFLTEEEYSEYKNADVSKQLIKGVNFYHENDFLLTPIPWNSDRENTGGGRLEVTTDLLKMRLLPFINNSKILTYQGFFYGIDAYTPYIRFGDGEEILRDMSYKIDRPFGSFQYFGRSKYRINYNGVWKLKTDFRVGSIGKLGGQKVQDVLHRDINVESVHVQGWENQIANGGRLAFNIDHFFDLSLFSQDGDIFRPKRRYYPNTYKSGRNWLNIYSPVELRLGHEMTSYGFGLGISNISLKDRSGTSFFNIPDHRFNTTLRGGHEGFKNVWDRVRKSVFLGAEFKYRRLIHNSLLEGFGVFPKSKELDRDGIQDERTSSYYLNSSLSKGTVNRNIAIFNTFFAIKIKKTTFFWNHSLNTREFSFEDIYINNVVNFANKPNYPNTLIRKINIESQKANIPLLQENSTINEVRKYLKENNFYAIDEITKDLYTRKWYGYGTIGVNFTL